MSDIPKNRQKVSVDVAAFLSRWASIMNDSANNDGNSDRREIARAHEAEFREAFKQAEADADEIDRLRARVAELEAAKGEPVAFLHQVVCGDGEPDQALSFAPDNFPLAGVLGYRSLSHEPLYTAPPAPTMDVDAISDEAIERAERAVWSECGRCVNAKLIRTVAGAIFNKGE